MQHRTTLILAIFFTLVCPYHRWAVVDHQPEKSGREPLIVSDLPTGHARHPNAFPRRVPKYRDGHRDAYRDENRMGDK